MSNVEENQESQETPESTETGGEEEGWQPPYGGNLHRTMLEGVEEVDAGVSRESQLSQEQVAERQEHDYNVQKAQEAALRGDTEKFQEHEWHRQRSAKKILEEPKPLLQQKVEKAALTHRLEPHIRELQTYDAEELAFSSPHPQQDVEKILNTYNRRSAGKTGKVFVTLHSSRDTSLPRWDNFSGDDIVEVPMTKQDWEYFERWAAGDTSQDKLRRYLDNVLRPTAPTMEAAKEKWDRKAAETAAYIKEMDEKERRQRKRKKEGLYV
jgi:hypothetical protein